MKHKYFIRNFGGETAPFNSKKANELMDRYWEMLDGESQKSYSFLVKRDNQDLKNFNFALSIIKYYLFLEVDGDRNTIQLIATRLAFNSASALTLALNHYYLASMMIIRDIMETGFLLDYFSHNPDALSDWATCSDEDRKEKYKASVIYKKLAGLEKTHNNARKFIYSEYSKLFTHITPVSGFFIDKEGKRLIDQSFRENHLKFCIWELSLWTSFSSMVYLDNLFPKSTRSPNSQIDKLTSSMKEYLFEVERDKYNKNE